MDTHSIFKTCFTYLHFPHTKCCVFLNFIGSYNIFHLKGALKFKCQALSAEFKYSESVVLTEHIFPAPPLNVVCKNLMLLAVH